VRVIKTAKRFHSKIRRVLSMSNFLIKKGCKEMALNQDSSASGIQQWTGSQNSYQYTQLSSRLEAPGKLDSHQRLSFFEGKVLCGKSVIDVCCNVGYHCLWVKKTRSGQSRWC
jgi:hypothetical protein